MKNKKGSVAVVAIIIAIVAITAGVVGWMLAKRTSISSSQPVITTQNSSQIPEGKATSEMKNVEPSQSVQKSPEQVLQDYYESYISYLNHKVRVNPETGGVNNSLNSEFVTSKIIESYEKLTKKGIFADPFICAQNFPDDASKLSAAQVRKDAFSAKYNVTIFTNWPPISVTVIKTEGKWKINEIKCANGNTL